MVSNTESDSRRDHSSRQRAQRTRVLLGIGLGLYLITVGGLVGTLAERIRFDYRRTPVLARYEALLHARQATLMTIEREVAQGLRPKIDPAPVLFVVRAEISEYSEY